MKRKLIRIVTSIVVLLGLFVTPLSVTEPAFAATKDEVCKGVGAIDGGNACTDTGPGNKFGAFIKKIINILLFIIGAIAVLMIVIGGIRYVVSGGDQGSVTGAKNTILYAVVGLIVALMSFAIVNFVLASI